MKRGWRILAACAVLAVCCTASWFLGRLSVKNEGDARPQEGKTAGTPCVDAETLSGVYLYNYEQDARAEGGERYWELALYPAGAPWNDENREGLTAASVTQISGDKNLSRVFSVSRSEDTFLLRCNTEGIRPESGEARYRLYMESGHYCASAEFTVRWADFREVEWSLRTDRFTAAVGKENDPDRIFGDLILVSPEMPVLAVFEAPGDTGTAGDAPYRIEGGNVIPGRTGEYPLNLVLMLGKNMVRVTQPVTMAAEDIRGERTEEIPAEGESGENYGLRLELEHGDDEYTIYAGGRENWLGFWDIRDYERLSSAWGGQPGWSIQPEESSEDVMRWSNESRDGKSVWAFFGRPAEEGDYAGVLTCSWHGQTASARIVLHVVPSPTGVLEAVHGLDSSYTMELGETLEISLQPEPAGWTHPDREVSVGLWHVTSVLDDGYLWYGSGAPYFDIRFGDGFGPVSITATRSGVYSVGFRVEAGNFSFNLSTGITVKNSDGSVPGTAEEMEDAETRQPREGVTGT